MAEVIEIPYRPRPLQLAAIHAPLESHRFVVAVCHRRFGKTVGVVNELQKQALLCTKPRPRFYYIAPTYRQGKAVAWDYIKHYALPLPHEVNESELRVDYPNGGQVRIIGADNPDALRGLYADGVVLDEYGLMAKELFSEVVRPLLADRQGWALFIGTPNGKNQFYDVVARARREEQGWFLSEYKASQTGILDPDELQAARAVMTQDEYDQEFECSFEASVKGAVFMRELIAAREDGRLTRVPYEPTLPVDTDWDLGVGDSTAIWFSQTLHTGEIRLIDFYEASGEGLHHYKAVLDRKPYAYSNHWAPHDIDVRELGTGVSRLMTARTLGLNFLITPKVEHLEDGIHAARMLLPRCWFDAEKCRSGIEALQAYRWDYNARIKEFTARPVHDWASHAADAFRGLAYRWYQKKRSPEAEARAALRKAQYDPRDRPLVDRNRGRAGY